MTRCACVAKVWHGISDAIKDPAQVIVSLARRAAVSTRPSRPRRERFVSLGDEVGSAVAGVVWAPLEPRAASHGGGPPDCPQNRPNASDGPGGGESA